LSRGARCETPREKADSLDGKYRDFIIPLLQSQNIPYFDPAIYLCSDKICSVIDGNKILMADAWHISAFGGEYLATKGRVKLDELFVNNHLQ
jgi:hypothetical protein